MELALTIKNFQVKRGDVVSGVEVVVEEVARRVEVRAGVDAELHLRRVGEGAVLDACALFDEVLPEPLNGIPTRHVWSVRVGDIEDSAISVHILPYGDGDAALLLRAADGVREKARGTGEVQRWRDGGGDDDCDRRGA